MAETNKDKKNEPTLAGGLFDDTQGNVVAENVSELFDKPKKSNQATSSGLKPSDSGGDKGNGDKTLDAINAKINSLTKQLENVEKRYGDSSEEAINLKAQLNQYSPYIPILEKMSSDPGLVQVMHDAIANGEKPKSPIEALGLKDDFEYDADRAMREPDSDDAKVLRYMIDVQNKKQNERQNQANVRDMQALRQEREFDNFASTQKLTDDQKLDMRKYMDKHVMTYEDIHFLINRKNLAKGLVKRAQEETLKQIANVNKLNGNSLGNSMSEIVDTESDDAFFDKIFGQRETGLFG